MRKSAYQEHYEAEGHHWWFRGRWAVIEALLSRTELPTDPRILDAGCGTGGNLVRYAERGRAEGIDFSADAVAFCHQRGFDAVKEAGLEELPFEDNRFDLVAASDVLEHVDAENRALREMLRVTAPGGAMLLTVPAYAWLWSEEDEKLHHFRRYTRRRLRLATKKAGWEPEIATYFNTALLPAIAAARQLPGGSSEKAEVDRTPAYLNGPLSLPMRGEARLIAHGVRLPVGVSIGIVCRKPV